MKEILDGIFHWKALHPRINGDDPERVKREIRERCAALLDEDFEHLLFAHGDPLIGGGREALCAVAEG